MLVFKIFFALIVFFFSFDSGGIVANGQSSHPTTDGGVSPGEMAKPKLEIVPEGTRNELEQYLSKIQLYYNDVPVEIPEQIAILEVIKTITNAHGFQRKSVKKKNRGNIELVPTAFWRDEKTQIEDLDALSIHEIHTSGELTHFRLNGRVFSQTTQEGIDSVSVTAISKDGSLLTKSFTDKKGVFQLLGWIPKLKNEIQLTFERDGFKSMTIETNSDQVVLDPVIMKAKDSGSTGQGIKKVSTFYRLIGIRPQDGLGGFVTAMDAQLQFLSKNGVKHSLKMHESSEMYAVLLDDQTAEEIEQCTILLKDPQLKWNPVEREIECSRPVLDVISLVHDGPVFASGKVLMNDSGNARAWLVKKNDQSPMDIVDVVAVEPNDGSFEFAYRKGMEDGVYSIVLSWDADNDQDPTPLWVYPDETLTPLPYGTTDTFSLSQNMELRIPDHYLDMFKNITRVYEGDQFREAKFVAGYEEGTTKVVDAINTRIRQLNKPIGIALNLAKRFEVDFVGRNQQRIGVPNNRFLDGKVLSTQKQGEFTSVMLTGVPVGNRSMVRKIKRIMSNAVEAIDKDISTVGGDLILNFGTWTARIEDWKQKKSGFEAQKAIRIPRPSNLERILQQNLVASINNEKGIRTSTINVVMLINDGLLNAAEKTSFELQGLNNHRLGAVEIIIISESYMEGVDGQYQEKITLLKEAFRAASSVGVQIVNPFDSQDMDKRVKAILPKVDGQYSWITNPQTNK